MEWTRSEGSRVWLRVNERLLPSRVIHVADGRVWFSTDHGEELSFEGSQLLQGVVTPMHQTSVEGVGDMSALTDLHEASILRNLQLRYRQDKIYTNIGSILTAVNPYKHIDGLYSACTMEQYRGHQQGEMPPHIYAMANECYSCLWKRQDSQCVLISGETGAGKTESTKLLLQFLSVASQRSVSAPTLGTGAHVEQAILESSPVMEAFGNAKTVYNNNSSRFGKFIQLDFSESGNIDGGCIIDYLLEKNRVVRQVPAERNFHVFYALLAGLEPEQKAVLGLSGAVEFRYLQQWAGDARATLEDRQLFDKVMGSLQVLGFTGPEVQDVIRLLAAVLQLGNIRFLTAAGAQIANTGELSVLSELLGLDAVQVAEVLTHRSLILRGEEISPPLTTEQAASSRDSLSMALYSQCFSWIIRKINARIRGPRHFKSIGILDIFGFENFEVNRFEQFNINFANEKLQEYFNKHIFSLEQLEYHREGLSWDIIDWMDNAECLDLIEKKLGLLSLINEESRFPKGTDVTLLEKLHSQHATNSFYVKPRLTDSQFGIRHYAAEVMYDVHGFLEKNRDTFRDDILHLLKDSRLDFIYELFERACSWAGGEDSLRGGTQRRKPTVSSQFRDSLHSLMAMLSLSNPFFIRCIKPNVQKVAGKFDEGVVLNQLRYSGMLETVKIRRAGFPVRRPFPEFYLRYKMLLPERTLPEDWRSACRLILAQCDGCGSLWRLGKTKVFLKEALEQQLETGRMEARNRAVVILQANLRGYQARTSCRTLLHSLVVIQRTVRGYLWRRRFVRCRRAAVLLQRRWRLVLGLRAERREEERREEERREEERKVIDASNDESSCAVNLLERPSSPPSLPSPPSSPSPPSLAQPEWPEPPPPVWPEREWPEPERTQEEREWPERTQEEREWPELERTQAEREQLQEVVRLEREIQRLRESGCGSLHGQTDDQTVSQTDDQQQLLRLEQEASEAALNFLELLNLGVDTSGQCVAGDVGVPDHGSLAQEGGQTLAPALTSPSDGQRLEPVHPDPSDEQRLETTLAIPSDCQTPAPTLPTPSDGQTLVPIHPAPTCRPSLGSVCIDHPVPGWSVAGPDGGGGGGAEQRSEDGAVDEGVYDTVLEWPDPDSEEEPIYSLPPDSDPDSDYDHDEMEEGLRPSPSVEAYPPSPPVVVESEEEMVPLGCSSERRLKAGRQDNPYFHSYLYMKGGLMSGWRRCWFVLADGTLMWFRAKQEALKSGWLHKKGGGRSTLSRRNWKRRWCVLRAGQLLYYLSDHEDRLKGQVDVRGARAIVDNVEKENALDIVTADRTFHIVAESPEDASDWFRALSAVHTATQQELEEMQLELANPKNAVGTIDVGLIDSACASDNPDRPNSFLIITANRAIHCTADSAEAMHHWIALLQRPRRSSNACIARGWLYKGVCVRGRAPPLGLRRRWFVLTATSLDYYRSPEPGARLGTLALTSLCSARLPTDDSAFRLTGYWQLAVHGRKRSYRLYTDRQQDAARWASAIHNLIDGKVPVETPTQQLIREIKERSEEPALVEQTYRRNPILRYTPHPLHSPLLPLPYGDLEPCLPEGGSGSLRGEAVRLFRCLHELQTTSESLTLVASVLQTCQRLPPLRDELYCQLIKQTNHAPPLARPSSLHLFRLLSCMSCTFLPSRSVLHYLHFHLHRVRAQASGGEVERYACFILDSLRKTRQREAVPSRQELRAVMFRREMSCTVHCHGGGACPITIDSHTTAGQVVGKLLRGLGLEGSRNTFALFERGRQGDRAIAPRQLLADVLARAERLSRDEEQERPPWCLYFKLYCFLDIQNVPRHGLEFVFMFEQAHECLISGHFPAPEDTLRLLAALRLQYLQGDHSKGPLDLQQVYPVCRLRAKIFQATKSNSQSLEKRRTSFLDGTLRLGLRTGSLRKQKMEEEQMLEMWMREEMSAARASVVDKWMRLQGMKQQEAMLRYMDIVMEWPGYGSTLFDVECKEGGFPSDLWLGVSADTVSIYKRGEARPLERFGFQEIAAFGAPQPSTFRLTAAAREMFFETTQVAEITKIMKAHISNIVKAAPAAVTVTSC